MLTSQSLQRVANSYVIVWTLSPVLAYGLTWRVLLVVAMVLWLLLELRAPRSVLLRPSWPVIGAAVFALYTLAIEWLVPDAGLVTRHFQILIMFFFLVVGESLRRGRDGDARFYFWLILLILPIWSFTTLSAIDEFGTNVARTISRSSDIARELTEEGVGGYAFVYAVLLCLPFVLYLSAARRRIHWLSGTRRLRRLGITLLVANAVLCALVLVRAGFSIALFLAVFAAGVLFLIRSRRVLQFGTGVVVAALLAVMAVVMMEPILSQVQDLATGTEYEAKIADIRHSLEEGDSVGTLEGRNERYLRSVRLFFEHPIVGTLRFDDIGKHSAILDRFAQYGLAAGVLFTVLLVYVPVRALRDRRVPIGLALAFLVVAFGFPLINNVFAAWGLVLYVFAMGAFSLLGVPLDKREKTSLRAADGSHA